MKHTVFGVAGFPPNFFKSDLKKNRDNIFQWLNHLGLNWIELQCTYGVKMPREQAERYRKLAEEFSIGISIHAPYFISFGSKDKDVVLRSKERMLQCFELAEWLNSKRIIFHPGYASGRSRADGTLLMIEALLSIQSSVPSGVCVYPETAGKRSQIGSFEEILEICHHVPYARPCLDMAHIHGFRGGVLTNQQSIERLLRASQYPDLHIHMYPVEVDHNGEKRHMAFSDPGYHPSADNFVSALKSWGNSAVVICEARDTQDVGALLMQRLYRGG